MATTRRQRRIAADPRAIWDVLEDPHHMPRWWPGVMRMEGVHEDRFTQVFKTKRGRAVRVDFHVVDSRAPSEGEPGSRTWEQEIEGSPFERVLTDAVTEVTLEPDAGGTRVTIELRQKLRGYSRTGSFMLRRATRRKLDEALDGLERILA